jgi:hypothetical protein
MQRTIRCATLGAGVAALAAGAVQAADTHGHLQQIPEAGDLKVAR